MTREEFLRNKIGALGTMKDFSEKIGMPYSTLLSILKNVGGASIDNVFKICHGLNINADDLSIFESSNSMVVSNQEKELIKKYRQLPQAGKAAVDTMLNVQYDLVKPKLSVDTETS